MKIYRKRFIPNETIDISQDKVVFQDEKILVTKWIPIKPREDIGSGISYTIFDKGWKISKFFDKKGDFLFWYCDIIDYIFENDVLILIDLLVDVKIDQDGRTYEILDEDELEIAYKNGLIDISQKEDALKKLNELIKIIEDGSFPPSYLSDIC